MTENIIKINRASAPPSRWTFIIPPIAKLINRYVGGGKGWIDPFAGKYSPAEFTNDLNPDMPTKYHMEAVEFCRQMQGPFKGLLFDPPYSYRQIKDCYEGIGLKVTQQDTQSEFYSKVLNAICDKIEFGGYAISCGWNSSGLGKNRGFDIIEVLLIAHGFHSNDTIVTVEIKRQASMCLTLEEYPEAPEWF